MTRTRSSLLPEGASFGRKENWLPCSISVGVALLAIVLFEREGWWRVSVAIFILVDVYILVVLVEMALRSKRDEWRIFELPHRLWSIPLLFCLLAAVVCSFANLYVQSGSVKNNGTVLTDRGDAVYFSVVTITTLGDGDFIPTEPKSKTLVIYEPEAGFYCCCSSSRYLPRV